MAMHVEALVVSPFEENTYLVWDGETKRGFVLDPGDEGPRILKRIQHLDFKPEAILLTHGHSDHIGAVRDIWEEYKIPIYIGDGEEAMLSNPSKNLSALFGMSITTPPPDHLLVEGQQINVAGFDFCVIETPGHSPASIAYRHENVLFGGDVLFMGSIGRSDLPGADHDTLMKTLKEKILTMPDDVLVYSGHGPMTTIGRERKHNPFLLELLSSRA